MPKNMTLALLTCLALSASPAIAEEQAMDNSKMDHSMMKMESADTGKTDYFAASRDEMHKNMAVEPSGNVDVDFAAGMIPHHEGAVAMAKVELEHGKDPELRKLAEDIIKAQDKEIAFMKAWLEKNKVKK